MPLRWGHGHQDADSHGRLPGQNRLAETAPLPGIAGYAAGAGWQGPLDDPGLGQGAESFVHDMMRNLWGGGGTLGPERAGASKARYGNAYRGWEQGHEFIVANVFVTMRSNYAGAGFGIDRPGSACVMDLGCVLPSLTVNLRNRSDYQWAMTQQVRLGDREFDRVFDVRSGQPEFAARLLAPMTGVLMSRDDWVLYLEFGQFVSVSSAPLASAAEMAGRVQALAGLVSLIPADVRAQYALARPADAAPDPDLDTPENRARLQAMMRAMPADQRRQLIGRLRTEGPNVVYRELLEAGDPPAR